MLPTLKNFPSGIIKIQLCDGFCHTVVLDKDSKFCGVCRNALDLLHINCHVLSGNNHNPMIVEPVNQYLTKGLKIMTSECNSVGVALEAILLLLNAWNSCPIPSTDISCSLVAVDHEFAFPIDYSTNKHWELTSSRTKSVESYPRNLATCLSAFCEVVQLLVQEQRAYHRELINSCCPDPCTYSVGNIVFACRATRSGALKGHVDKLTYTFTGPCRITAIFKGASYSYELEHCTTPHRKEKKHASKSNLSTYPLELIPFHPFNGSNTWYGQLHKPAMAPTFKEAGINRFDPVKLFKISTNFLLTNQVSDFHWQSLSELNDGLFPFHWLSGEE